MGTKWGVGIEWIVVCHDWWEAFAPMCKAAWQEGVLSGHEQLRASRNHQTMGAKHIALGWSKTLRTHMWIDHMYAYVAKWGTLVRFSCFGLEGLKRMLRNSGGGKLVA